MLYNSPQICKQVCLGMYAYTVEPLKDTLKVL